MGRYSLARHVFLCVDDGHVVLLDLKRDRYWALEAAGTVSLSGLVPGWPVKSLDAPLAGSCDPSEAEEVIEVLNGRGILSGSDADGKSATPVQAIVPRRELLHSIDEGAAVPAGALLRFIAASVAAKAALRMRSFASVIEGVRKRNTAGAHGAGPDLALVRALVERFMRLRVFLFSAKNECLFDSLALLKFLAWHGVLADWVFGVQARPFAAHCWVQLQDVVINDTVEHVSTYTPIMVA